MDRIHDIIERLRQTNRYVLAALLFLVWMLTLADVDLLRMVKTHAERNDIETKMEKHRQRIAELEPRAIEHRPFGQGAARTRSILHAQAQRRRLRLPLRPGAISCCGHGR